MTKFKNKKNFVSSKVEITQLINLQENNEDLDYVYSEFEKQIGIFKYNSKQFQYFGKLCMELALMEKSEDYLIKSIHLDENTNIEKQCLLGQILKGTQSLKQFKLASEKQIEKYNIDKNDIFKNKICKIYSSLSELQMTDLCNETDAKNECERQLKLGLEYDNTNIELLTLQLKFQNVTGENQKSIEVFDILYQDIDTKLLKNKRNDQFDITEFDQNEDILMEIARESLYIQSRQKEGLAISEFILEYINELCLEAIQFICQIHQKNSELQNCHNQILVQKEAYSKVKDEFKNNDEIKQLNSALEEIYFEIKDKVNIDEQLNEYEGNGMEEIGNNDDEMDWESGSEEMND